MNDASGISEDLARRIWATQIELRGVYRDSLRVGVQLGHLLTEAKGECRHGEWGGWLKSHFEGSARHAQRYMELAREYPNPDDIPNLSLREALALIQGKRRSTKQQFRHERLSRSTADAAIEALQGMTKIVREKLIHTLLVEGLTPRHEAMRRAKKIEAEISRLRAYIAAQQSGVDALPSSSATAEPAAGVVAVPWSTITEIDPCRELVGVAAANTDQ